MCGIFGLITKKNNTISSKEFNITLKKLFSYSGERGKEASGVLVKSKETKKISILKRSIKSTEFIGKKEYKLFSNKFLDKKNINQGLTILGHTRIATNGAYDDQPISKNGVLGVHNGIICNVENLWAKNNDLTRNKIIDTELLFALIKKNIVKNKGKDISKALSDVFEEIEGTASIGITFDNFDNSIIGSNCGSLYYFEGKEFFCFASERHILEISLKNLLKGLNFKNLIKKVEPINFVLIDEKNFKIKPFSKKNIVDLNLIRSEQKYCENEFLPLPHPKNTINMYTHKEIKSILHYDLNKIKKIKRCTNCILPETHPFIKFNASGVCNYCEDYSKRRKRMPKGLKLLNSHVENIRKINGINCIMMLSGGRDSCYALHIVKKVLKLNPVALTYDWGMLTDLGRRNQSRMCEKLGVEHIVVSADINKKRHYVKKNVEAFLHKPHLGSIGLFMAGDKAYHHYAKELKERLNLPLISGGSPLEFTFFKEGFSGIKPSFQKRTFFDRFQLIKFFSCQALKNRKYINSSIIDNLLAYKYYYFDVLDPINLFHYLDWNEDEVNNVLTKNYNWEFSNDTTTSWRIGDGTAAFYNYIYNTVAGFTENDCFRSNQIMEGVISREEALKRVYDENRPRLESLKWYCNAIQIDLKSTILKINNIKKLY